MVYMCMSIIQSLLEEKTRGLQVRDSINTETLVRQRKSLNTFWHRALKAFFSFIFTFLTLNTDVYFSLLLHYDSLRDSFSLFLPRSYYQNIIYVEKKSSFQMGNKSKPFPFIITALPIKFHIIQLLRVYWQNQIQPP